MASEAIARLVTVHRMLLAVLPLRLRLSRVGELAVKTGMAFVRRSREFPCRDVCDLRQEFTARKTCSKFCSRLATRQRV
jgi:hypothetical protein